MNRVCHIVQSYYPRDPRIRRQAEALYEAGFVVDVICLRGPGEKAREVVNGVNVTRVPVSRQRGSILRYVYEYGAFFKLAALTAAFRGRRYDVIHVSNMPDFLVFTAAVPKMLGTRVLLDEHDPFPELFKSKYGFADSHPVIRFLRWQEKHSLRFPHHVLTTTEPFKAHYDAIVPQKPVSVVMNLPDERLFRPPDDLESVLNPSDGFTLLYAGTVTGIYALDLIVRAVARLRGSIPGLRFRILGEGDAVPGLRDLAEELGVSDAVELVGDVPFAKVPEYLASSNVGVSTLKLDPLTDKCFNNKAGEYVAMGLPCIVTRTTAMAAHFPPDAVRFVEPGSLESIEEAIVELHRDPDLRRRMSDRGLEFSRGANWSREKAKYIDLIRSLCRAS